MQVGFGDVWKQSLSELSGGQRSLLALSLILAMLLFKPAPIYILDEVRQNQTDTASMQQHASAMNAPLNTCNEILLKQCDSRLRKRWSTADKSSKRAGF